MLQLAWRAADERNQFALQQIQSEYKVIAMQCQAEVEKVKQANEAEKEKLRAELSGDGANNANASMNGNANVDADVESLIKAAVEDTERKHSEQIASLRAELEKAQNSRSATTTSENDNEDIVQNRISNQRFQNCNPHMKKISQKQRQSYQPCLNRWKMHKSTTQIRSKRSLRAKKNTLIKSRRKRMTINLRRFRN